MLGRASGLCILLRIKARTWAAASLGELALKERPREVLLGKDATGFQHRAGYSSKRQWERIIRESFWSWANRAAMDSEAGCALHKSRKCCI